MPLIQVNILEGRTSEQKEELIIKMTDLVSEVLNSPTSAVRVMINEMKPEHWGIAGESVRSKRLRENKKGE